LSVIPILADGSKAPSLPAWAEYQNRLATKEEITSWFTSSPWGIAIVCGVASGGLEVFDFDDLAAFDTWVDAMDERLPGFVPRLPVIATPGGGRHVYVLRPQAAKGDKLAFRPGTRKRPFAELKGKGGYVLAPGSPAACHPSGGIYEQISGPPLAAFRKERTNGQW
jgi:hypothetical protein